MDGNILYTNSDGENYILVKDAKDYKTLQNSKNSDKKQVLIEKNETGYYKTKENGEIEYVDFVEVPFVAKINLPKNSIVTIDEITKNNITDDMRYVEYNMLELPTTVQEGDYVDIRLTLPNGQDLIVISKKEIKSIQDETLGFEMSQDEMLMMNSAIVEAYIMTASKFHVMKYIDPGIQGKAINTYTPTDAVKELISTDPNIVDKARTELQNKFSDGIRGWINNQRGIYQDSETQNLEQGIQQEIEKAKAAREKYLSGLSATTYEGETDI